MPSKTCPKCNTAVSIRKLSCVYGYVFVLRRTQIVSVNTRKLEKQAKRALQAFNDVLKCREQVKNHVAKPEPKKLKKRKLVKETMIKHIKRLVEPKKLTMHHAQ